MTQRPLTRVAVATLAGVAMLAVVAFAMSFLALADLAERSGIPSATAWGFPTIVDGAIVLSMLVILLRRANGMRAALAWFTLTAFGLVSVLGNGIHAATVFDPGNGVSLGVAIFVSAVPPLSLALMSELLVQMLQMRSRDEQPREQRAEQVSEQPAEQLREQPAEQVSEQPLEQPHEQHSEQHREQVSTIVAHHVEQPREQASTTVAHHVEQPRGQHDEHPREQVASAPVSTTDLDRAQVVQQARELLEQELSISAAADKLGVSRPTLSRWLKADEKANAAA